ncbi:MAG: hypothetical protein FJ102_06925 [Deltaproteobacteria bacterium]|nr:hypothetical protein [Deltaproteobacteria bacterium]
MRRALLLLVPCVIGCENDRNLNRIRQTDEFDQAPSNMVDILWVIDDSTSMQEEQAAVVAAAEDFLTQLETEDMDFQLGVITTDMESTNQMAGRLLGNPPYLTSECRLDGDPSDCTYGEQFKENVVQGTGGSDQEKGLEAAIAAVSVPLVETFNDGFVRDGAMLMIVNLTDENDCSDGGRFGPSSTGEDCYTQYDDLTPVPDLVRSLKDAKAGTDDEVVMSGIIGPDAEVGCQTAVPGKRYQQAIQLLSGVEANICLSDYAPVMESLGLAATGILTNFQLTNAADATEEGDMTVTVTNPDGTSAEVTKDDTEGWSYVEEYAQVQFNGSTVPVREAHIVVEYYVTGPVPNGAGDDTEEADTATTTP